MPALVPELVDMASNPVISTTDLLRRALVVARRLAAPELIDWINSELTGYTGEVPEYRRMRGDMKAENPYNGAIPFFLPPEIANQLTNFYMRQSVPELLHLRDGSGTLVFHFPPEIERTLIDMMMQSGGPAMRPAMHFSRVQIERVLETVRSKVLDWALDLESRGIRGDGMSFTVQEKEAVQQQHYHFGDVSGSQIQIGSQGSHQTQTSSTGDVNVESLRGLVDALAEALSRAALQADVSSELRAELATLRAQAESPKPKWDVIKATARSIKNIAEGAAGEILGDVAKPHVQTLLALASAIV